MLLNKYMFTRDLSRIKEWNGQCWSFSLLSGTVLRQTGWFATRRFINIVFYEALAVIIFNIWTLCRLQTLIPLVLHICVHSVVISLFISILFQIDFEYLLCSISRFYSLLLFKHFWWLCFKNQWMDVKAKLWQPTPQWNRPLQSAQLACQPSTH